MRYFVRAVKYFVSMAVIVIVLLGVFTYVQNGTFNILDALSDGVRSAVWIAVILALFSAVYPRFGYADRPLDVRGDTAEIEKVIRQYMDERGYRVEKEELNLLTFRVRSPFTQFFRMWEDRISFNRTHTGFTIEGLNREIVRLKSGIEYRFENRDIL